MSRRAVCAIVIAVVCAVAPEAARWNFIPDWTFKGNDLAKEWTVVGQATWTASWWARRPPRKAAGWC
jgi:hypothetical protein